MLDVDKETIGPKNKSVESPESFVVSRVLVVDDDEIVRMILEDILKKAGYEVILASDGEEGIRKIQESSPALVITDIVMPKKSGTEFILEVLAEYPNLHLNLDTSLFFDEFINSRQIDRDGVQTDREDTEFAISPPVSYDIFDHLSIIGAYIYTDHDSNYPGHDYYDHTVFVRASLYM